MYTIEYNIRDLTTLVVHRIQSIAEMNDFEWFYHGWDRLVLKSDRGVNFTKMINEISNLCQTYAWITLHCWSSEQGLFYFCLISPEGSWVLRALPELLIDYPKPICNMGMRNEQYSELHTS